MKLILLKVSETTFDSGLMAYGGILPQERQKKIQKLRKDQDKLLSFWAGILIRKVCGQEELQYGPKGKPYCEKENVLNFSIAHDWPYVILAISEYNTGVDIEKIKCANLRMAEHYFTDNEFKRIHGSSNQDEFFYQVWTGKEAYFKMTGSGLTVPLNSADVFEKSEKGQIQWKKKEDFMIAVCCERPFSEFQLFTVETKNLRSNCDQFEIKDPDLKISDF